MLHVFKTFRSQNQLFSESPATVSASASISFPSSSGEQQECVCGDVVDKRERADYAGGAGDTAGHADGSVAGQVVLADFAGEGPALAGCGEDL